MSSSIISLTHFVISCISKRIDRQQVEIIFRIPLFWQKNYSNSCSSKLSNLIIVPMPSIFEVWFFFLRCKNCNWLILTLLGAVIHGESILYKIRFFCRLYSQYTNFNPSLSYNHEVLLFPLVFSLFAFSPL